MDNVKVTFPFGHLNKHFFQLNLDVPGDNDIRVEGKVQKDVHLKHMGKGRLVLMMSGTPKNVPIKPCISPSHGLNNKNEYQ